MFGDNFNNVLAQATRKQRRKRKDIVRTGGEGGHQIQLEVWRTVTLKKLRTEDVDIRRRTASQVELIHFD